MLMISQELSLLHSTGTISSGNRSRKNLMAVHRLKMKAVEHGVGHSKTAVETELTGTVRTG